MQCFLNEAMVFLNEAMVHTESHSFVVVILPLFIVGSSFVFHFQFLLARDSMQTPPFPHLRGLMLTLDRNADGKSRCKLPAPLHNVTCCWFSWCFPALCIVLVPFVDFLQLAVLGEGGIAGRIWAGISAGAILWTLISLSIFMLAETYLIARSHKTYCKAIAIEKHLMCKRQWPGEESISDVEHEDPSPRGRSGQKILFGQWELQSKLLSSKWRTRGGDPDQSEQEEEIPNKAKSQKEGGGEKDGTKHRLYGRGAVPLLISGLGLWIVGYTIVSLVLPESWPITGAIITVLLVATSMFLLNGAVKEMFPPLRRPTFYHLALYIFALSIFALCSGVYFARKQPYPHDSPVMRFIGNSTATWWNANESPYPVCSMRWGGAANISIMDLAPLARYAYDQNDTNHSENLKAGFINEERGFDFAVSLKCEKCEPLKSVRIRTSRFTKNGTHGTEDSSSDAIVVAVRGTDSIGDVFADLALYTSITSLQLASFLVPVLDMFPNYWLACLLSNGLSPYREREERMMFAIVDHVTNFRKLYPNASIILTGHSLGGGMAAAVSGQTSLPAVVFSAPGAHFTRQRFKTNSERQYRNVVNIQPDNDIVSRVDRHSEVLQNIECRTADNVEGGPLTCHSISKTVCELWRVCGDPRGRDFSPECLSSSPPLVNRSELGKYLNKDSTAVNRSWSQYLNFEV